MSETEHRSTPPRSTMPLLPMVDHPPFMFAGFVFEGGDGVPARPGLYVLARQIGPFCYPVLMGEAEDMAAAVAEFRATHPAEAGEIDSWFWLERTLARQRAYVLRDLIGRYNPPLNVEHRKGRAAPEIAAFVPDRAAGDAFATVSIPVGAVAVTEAEIEQLVRRFYGAGAEDPVLAPVFARIPDFEAHVRIICDFWSRQLLGTERYKGNPFSAHITLALVPEHFNRWIELFNQTARAVLQPPAAERAIAKVEHMSHCFQTGLFLPAMDMSA
jgi:truncated hemoglobin YjbI